MFRKRTTEEALARLADSIYDFAPFTRPEVVRFDGGMVALRLQSAPDTFLLVQQAAGTWTAGDVLVDPNTGEPDTAALAQRLMRGSLRPLAPAKADLRDVLTAIYQRLISRWVATTESSLAPEEEKRMATDALAQIEARMQDPRPPLHP